MSSDSLLALFFNAPIFFALGLQAESFLAWGVEFTVVGDVSVESFQVDLVGFQSLDLGVYFSFGVV